MVVEVELGLVVSNIGDFVFELGDDDSGGVVGTNSVLLAVVVPERSLGGLQLGDEVVEGCLAVGFGLVGQ